MTKTELKRYELIDCVGEDLVFTVAMKPKDADLRAAAAIMVDGVQFEAFTNEEAEKLTSVIRTIPDGRVAGITKAESLELLSEYNKAIEQLKSSSSS